MGLLKKIGGALKKVGGIGAGFAVGGPVGAIAAGAKMLGNSGRPPMMNYGAVQGGGVPMQSNSNSTYGNIDRTVFGGWLPGGANPLNPITGRPVSFGPGGAGGHGCEPSKAVMASQVLSGQLQVVGNPQLVQREVAPPGYVLVCLPDGRKIAVLKEIAYMYGLKKRPQKSGGISRKDVQTARRVQAVITSMTTARKPKLALKSGRKR